MLVKMSNRRAVDLVESANDFANAHVHPHRNSSGQEFDFVFNVLPEMTGEASYSPLIQQMMRRRWVCDHNLTPFPNLILQILSEH
jgi:hypothetical protein